MLEVPLKGDPSGVTGISEFTLMPAFPSNPNVTDNALGKGSKIVMHFLPFRVALRGSRLG
ncbi:hypothetical protein ES703_12855 [subsurface metagenome]